MFGQALADWPARGARRGSNHFVAGILRALAAEVALAFADYAPERVSTVYSTVAVAEATEAEALESA